MIFKTINSSVDETRKTLALFNKDWNTYRRNWQKGFSQSGFTGGIKSIFQSSNSNSAISNEQVQILRNWNNAVKHGCTNQATFNRIIANADENTKMYFAGLNKGKGSIEGLKNAQNAAKTSTIGLTIAQTALNAAIGMGVGLLINLVIQGVNKLIHANEEAIESAKKLREEYEDFKATNASNISTLEGLKDEFEELSQHVSQYGDNIDGTTEQYERYKEIIRQIVGMSPSLAEGYDTENGYIADKNGLLERAIELQEIEYKNELRKITNLQNLKTSMAGYIAEYKDAFEGGFATEDMSATSTIKATDFSNALYQAFNFSERYNNGYDSEDLAREILKSLGVDNIDKEMEKFFNEYGYYQSNWFFDEYVDEIANNIDAVTDALFFESVGLDEDEFENRILTVKDCAQAYLDMKDSISMANESIQTDLRYIAEYADGYDSLSSEQQKFVNEFLKGFNIDDITSRDWFGNLAYDEDKMKSVKRQINEFVEALSQDESTKEALADLYAIPTDEQSISEFIEQFRNALEIIKTYCKENGIEIPIAISDSEQSINDLEAQYQRAVDSAKDKFDGYDPTAFFKENSINTQEEVDKWLEIAQAANSAAEAEKRYIQSSTSDDDPHTFTFTEEQSQAIDNYQSRMSTLKGTLAELSRTGSAGNLTDLQQEFPELTSTTDSLDVALQKLVNDEFSGLMETLDNNVPDSLRKELEKLRDEALEAGNGILSLSDALNNLQTNGDFLGGIRDRMGASDFAGFTASELQEMISKFPQMEDAVNAYLARLISAGDVYAELQNYYEIDKQNFIVSNQAKMYENDIFYQSSMEANADRINQLAEKYNADFANFKTVAQAKAAVEKQLLGDLNGEWSKYYKVVLGEDGIYKTQALYDEDSYDKQNDPFFISLMDKSTELDQFYKELAGSFQVPDLIKVDDTRLKNLGIGTKSTGSTTKEEEKEEEKVEEFRKQYNWIEKLLTKLSKVTEKWQKTSEKFFSWWKANAAIDKAIKSNRKEIHADYGAMDYYQKKADKVGLSKKYRDLVENGAINIQDIRNEGLADKIDQYTEWYEKIQDCKDAIEEAYDQERELIRQKLDNILTYYGTIEQYYDSIAGKFDAMTSLRESKGQRQSPADLLAEFQNATDQSDKKQEMADAYKYEYNTSESAEYYQQQLDSINENLKASAHYQKLLKDIGKLETKKANREAKGKDLSKADTAKLKQYYALKESLEANATAGTIDNYTRIYNKWYKLQQKIDSGKKLSTKERKNYNSYTQQLDDYADAKSKETTRLQGQIDEAIARMNGTSEKSATDAYEKTAQELRESYAQQIDDADGGLEDSATYQKLVAQIDNKQAELDKLNAIGEDKLTKRQKNRIKTLQSELSVLEDQRNALDKGASADNVTEYLKVYKKWKELDDKLKSGKSLTNAQTDNYDKWKAQLDAWTDAKQESIALLNSEMQDALEKLALEKQTQINENAAEVAEAQAKVYELAKQVAEFNVDNIEQEIDLLDSLVSAAKSYIGLYQTMGKEKLIVAGVIDKDDTRSLTEIMKSQYNDAIKSTDDKYKKLVAQQQEYQDLINAAQNNDWDSLFSKYGDSNETVNKLKELLEANDWDGNTWVSEWETALSEVNQEIIDCVNAKQELMDGLRENVDLAGINDAITQLGYLQDTLSSITGLINDDWLFGEDGQLTTYGATKVGLLVEQMENAKKEAGKYAEEIKMITSMEDSYASDKAYKEALENAKKNYFSSLSALQGYQDSIVSIMRKSDEEIISSLKDVIDARKKALQKKKELYEYGKTIDSSQKEINAIQAQIDALESLSGAMDAATKAKLAQLKADLADKEEALQETKDDHTYNLQIDALDELLATLENTMKGAADSVNKSFETYVQAINAAMDVYGANKAELNNWSNSIISTITGMGGPSGSTADLNLDLGSGTNSDGTTVSVPSVNVVNSDTVSAIEKTGAETQGVISELKESLANGLLVKATDPLPIFSPEMMNYLQSYVPQVAVNVNQTIPGLIRERNAQPVIQNHYDCLLKVEGNVDKDFAKVLPQHLEEAYHYTINRFYKEQMRLK